MYILKWKHYCDLYYFSEYGATFFVIFIVIRVYTFFDAIETKQIFIKNETERWYNSEMLLVNIWDTCTVFFYHVVAMLFLFRL